MDDGTELIDGELKVECHTYNEGDQWFEKGKNVGHSLNVIKGSELIIMTFEIQNESNRGKGLGTRIYQM